MAAVGYISTDEAEKAFQARLNLRPPGGLQPAGSYFLDLVLKDLEERYGSEVVHHAGLKVFTTLDPSCKPGPRNRSNTGWRSSIRSSEFRLRSAATPAPIPRGAGGD